MAQLIPPLNGLELHLFCPDPLHFLSLETWSELRPTVDFTREQLGGGNIPSRNRTEYRWNPGVQSRRCCLYCMELPVSLLALLGLRRGLHMPFLSTPQLPHLDPEHDPPIYAIRVPLRGMRVGRRFVSSILDQSRGTEGSMG